MAAVEALVQDGSRWLAFRDPVRIVEAWRPDQVAETIRQTEIEAIWSGRYAVGFVRYEAGAAFALDVHPVTPAPHDLPLVWFDCQHDVGGHSVDVDRAADERDGAARSHDR